MTYSTDVRSNQDTSLFQEEIAKLTNSSVLAQASAAAVSTFYPTQRPAVSFPLLTTGTGSAAFTAEAAPIALGNVGTDSVEATLYKITAGSQVSSEMLQDWRDGGSSQVASLIGNELVNELAVKLDTAFWGNTNTNGFTGLIGSLAGNTHIDTAGTTLPSPLLDSVIDAVYALQAADSRVQLSNLVLAMPPATAQALSKTKQVSGSAQYLTSLTQTGSVVVAGVNIPIVIARDIAPLTTATTGRAFYLIDKTAIQLVSNPGATRVISNYVQADDTYLLTAIQRWGLAVVRPAAIAVAYDVSP